MRHCVVFMMTTLSVGWVVPLWLSAKSFIGGVEDQLFAQRGSFPFFHFSRQMLDAGCLWFVLVAFAWIYTFIRKKVWQRMSLRSEDDLVTKPSQNS